MECEQRRRADPVRRGDIVLVDLEPVRGSEASKRRPAILVSNDGANDRALAMGRGVVAVVPITSNVAQVLPFQALIDVSESGLRRASKAQAEQVRSVDVARISGPVGRVSASAMLEVDDALRLHLSL